jgi:hypothetical protein
MFVQGFGPANFIKLETGAISKAKDARDSFKKPLFKVADSFEPSDAPERKELILSVRKKIRTGYYNSEPVLEDLSHGFAKVLNQIQ